MDFSTLNFKFFITEKSEDFIFVTGSLKLDPSIHSYRGTNIEMPVRLLQLDWIYLISNKNTVLRIVYVHYQPMHIVLYQFTSRKLLWRN